MNNFREGLNTLKEISDPEKMKMALERITGKKLADYEGIDALVGALMGYYNGELGKIDTKFKNYCPISVGSIDVRYDSKNPAELYNGTTWELITTGKYILSSDTALQVGGTNSITISKANLPNIKLKVDTFSLTTQPHNHKIHVSSGWNNGTPTCVNGQTRYESQGYPLTENGGGQNTGTASLSTENLGNGTALVIQPQYITLKFWKRLS